jgi:hypothetical protein
MDNDKEMFDAAMAPEPVEEVSTGQPRDEAGRFAPKEPEQIEAKTEVQAEPVQETSSHETAEPVKADAGAEEANVPSWRVRELREERDAFKRQLEQQAADFQRRMAQYSQPAPQPQPKPDLYENPDAFVDHGVRQVVDPLRQEFGALKEEFSKRDAIRTYGEEKVKAAYDAVANGINQRDPEVLAIYQRAMNTMDPYGTIVSWHQQKTVFGQIGSDPEAWFEKRLAERLKDPTFQAKQLQQIQTSVQPSTQRNIVQLPPSLNKATGSNVTDDETDANDMSSAGLFRHATAKRRR